ncbi:uncharacterized protein SPSK_00952 [Sporothrix schenckii 1099-18]|uniref:Uncharacterized protein n=1 Tax=Sporothrix schenckii 1099-18 TaxID=1397361 RepID=A0A0F2LW32_SPOSC|nr:uncharacterized protein SPSK_00952 [Sporothrix schenckii 1099-18]KJR81682.1 hypothetical protein SPSK_00952 [Sporothrix schenckii 1099-18]
MCPNKLPAKATRPPAAKRHNAVEVWKGGKGFCSESGWEKKLTKEAFLFSPLVTTSSPMLQCTPIAGEAATSDRTHRKARKKGVEEMRG